MTRLLLAVLFSALGWGCGCMVDGTACNWLKNTKIVFVGTVTEDSGEGWGTGPARMTVDEIFHGMEKETRAVEVDSDAGTSCYMRLQKGERYLIYGSPVAGKPGVVRRNVCSFSFAVRGNEVLLAALRGAERGTGAELTGKVTLKTVKYGTGEEGAAGVRVLAVAGETRLETVTDAGGAFAFSGVPAGTYHLDVKAEDYVMDEWRWPRGDVRMGPTGCGYQTLGVWPNGQVSGVVRGVNGAVVKGVNVQVFAKNDRGEMDSSHLRVAETDEKGAFVLTGLPAGEFAVGVNGEKYNDREAWAPVYFPGVRRTEAAKWIQLGRGEKVGGIELRLGEARKAAKLRVEYVFADGRPAPGKTVRLDDLEGRQRVFVMDGSVATVYVGESYRAVGSHYEGRTSYRGQSEVITITGPEASVRVVLLEEKR